MAKNNVDYYVKDFKKFVNKGNIFDLAVGVIIGSTFTAIVTSLVNDIIMPLISSFIDVDLTDLKWVLKDAVTDENGEVIKSAISLNYGNFFQYVINFLIVAIAIYLAIRTINSLKKKTLKAEINYLNSLKEKHPDWFDEDTDKLNIIYEKIKREHPEEFQNEIADKIEAKKDVKSDLEINNELLIRLNENLEKLYNEKKVDK